MFNVHNSLKNLTQLLDDGIQLERDDHLSPSVPCVNSRKSAQKSDNKIGVRVILGSEPFCVSYRQSEF